MIKIFTQQNRVRQANGKFETEDLIRGEYDKVANGSTTIEINGVRTSARVYNKRKLDSFIFIRNERLGFYFMLKSDNSLFGYYESKYYNSINGVFARGEVVEEDPNFTECSILIPQ